jgi:phosphonate transport system permease protein
LSHNAIGDRIWRRFTPAQRLSRFVVYLVIVAAIVVSIQTIEVIPEFLADAPEQVVDLFARMWPVDFAHYPGSVHDALIETIHIATLGTLLSIILALPGRRSRCAQSRAVRRESISLRSCCWFRRAR